MPVLTAVASIPAYSGCDWVKEYSDWNIPTMEAICRAESGGRYDAVNPTNYDGIGDYGLLQLHGQQIFDPYENVAKGHDIWLRQGYGAWTSYNSKVYLNYAD